MIVVFCLTQKQKGKKLGHWLPPIILCPPNWSTNYLDESGGQTVFTSAFTSVTLQLGGKFKENVLLLSLKERLFSQINVPL